MMIHVRLNNTHIVRYCKLFVYVTDLYLAVILCNCIKYNKTRDSTLVHMIIYGVTNLFHIS